MNDRASPLSSLEDHDSFIGRHIGTSADDRDLPPDLLLLQPQGGGTGLEAAKIAPGGGQARLERVQPQEGLPGTGGEAGLAVGQDSRRGPRLAPSSMGPRQETAEGKDCCEPKPEHKAALPSPRQGRGH